MRGKSIIVALIAMCLVSPFIWSGKAQDEVPALSVYPSAVYGSPLEGENEFIIEIQIANVIGLYAYGFTLKFTPLEKVIAPLLSSEPPYWEEGTFLKTAGETFFAMRYDKILGTIEFGCTLTGGEGSPGASGTGTLVQVHFKVLEAGESTLTLEDSTLYDSYGVEIVHSVTSGFYYGPTADLVSVSRGWLPLRQVGETYTMKAKVKNKGDIPLYIKANFQMKHKDGRTVDMWTGLHDLETASYDGWMQWMYPGVDGDFTGDGDPVGALAEAEGMVGDGDLKPVYGFYMEDYDPFVAGWSASRKKWAFYNMADLGYWEFEDITIPEGQTIVSVNMEVYAWSDRDLPSDMMDMYLYNGEVEYLYWSMGYGSHLYNSYPAWFAQDVTSMFDTQDKINAAAWWTEFFPYVSSDVEGTGDYVYSNTTSPNDGWMSVGYLSYGPAHPEWINWPDRVLAGTAPANNTILTVPGPTIMYYDADEDGTWYIGEPAIDDVDMDGVYTNTTDVVLVGDAPENGTALTAPIEDDCALYYDANTNGIWDVDEPAIGDYDLNGMYNPYWRPPVDPFPHQWHIDNVWESIYVDAVRLKVETLPLVQPGVSVYLEPVVFGPFTAQDIGRWTITVTIWYSYRLPLPAGAPPWNPGKKIITFKLWVIPKWFPWRFGT